MGSLDPTAAALPPLFGERSGERYDLGPAGFLGEGGEGRVYACGDRACKIPHDPARLAPPDKLAFLAALPGEDLARPLERLLEADGRPRGFAMPLLADAHPLARAGTAAFRQRHRLGDAAALALMERLRQRLEAVHAAGALVVDLNPLNVLLAADLGQCWLIDLDAWQVPGHPATALLDSVRDRHAPRHPAGHALAGVPSFDRGTDWFAFAITAFQFLTGLHPYQGQHPHLKGLDARMGADCSVFDPQVRRPPTARDPADLPAEVSAWFRAVFEDRRRDPPPPFGGRVRALVSPPPPPVRAGALELQRLFTVPESPEADGRLRATHEVDGERAALSAESLWLDHRRVAPAPAGPTALGNLGRDRRPVAAWIEAGRLQVLDLRLGRPWRCALAARALCAVDGTLFALVADQVVALGGVAHGAGGEVTSRVVARVRARGTELFEGVAFQRVPGARLATLLLDERRALTVTLPELAGGELLAAQASFAPAEGPGRPGGLALGVLRRLGDQVERWLVRLDPTGRAAPAWTRLPAESDAEVAVVVLPGGVVLFTEGPSTLRLCAAAPGVPGERVVSAPALAGLSGLVRLPGGVPAALIGRHLTRLRLPV